MHDRYGEYTFERTWNQKIWTSLEKREFPSETIIFRVHVSFSMFFVTYKTYLSALHISGAVSHVPPLPHCFTSTLDYVLWNPVSKTQLHFHSSLSRSTIQKDVRNKDMDSQLHRRLNDFNRGGPHLDRSQPCFGSQVLHGRCPPCHRVLPFPGFFFVAGETPEAASISSANAAAPPSDSHSGAPDTGT